MTATLTELAAEQDASLHKAQGIHRFIPLRSTDLATALGADPQFFGPDAQHFPALYRAIRDVIAQETEDFERQLMNDFAAHDPDCDTQPLDRDSITTLEESERLQRHLSYLLEKANFEHMPAAQLEAVVAEANSLGLRVLLDHSCIHRLSIWIRGHARLKRHKRTLRHPFRGETRTLHVFQRLVVIYQMRNDRRIGVKMFKDIPAADVEALLPHARVGMSRIDQAQLYFGSMGALGTAAWKLAQFLIFGAIQFTAVLTTLSLGMVALTFKAVTGYRRTQKQRDSQRTRHLYFQNVANNSAVIHTVLGMIAEEETKEAFLAYVFGPIAGFEPQALQNQVEQYLSKRFEINFRFEVHDGLETLERFELLPTAAGHPPVSPTEAIARLRTHWVNQTSRTYHRTMADNADVPIRTTLSSLPPCSNASAP